jgi:hypothetical protein
MHNTTVARIIQINIINPRARVLPHVRARVQLQYGTEEHVLLKRHVAIRMVKVLVLLLYLIVIAVMDFHIMGILPQLHALDLYVI